MARVSRRDVLRAGAAGAGMWLGGLRVSDLLAAVPAGREATFAPAGASSPPTSTDDIAYLTIAEAHELLKARKLTSRELVEACLARIAEHEGTIRAWITVFDEETLLAQADAADEEIKRGGPRSPLHGIPIGHKDLYDVEGVPTTAGSKVRDDVGPAEEDATAVALLREAGAIAVGKTNTHEFAYGVWTPPTCNPWDTSRTPGGSSGGSAAALASGMCLGATGSDTGGSIRIPSSLCNTVGIKPTYGRVSRAGLVPLAWSLDHAGPLARSVEDCALMLDAIAGPDPRDPTTADSEPPEFTSELGRDVSSLTVGVPTSVFFEGADPETEALVRTAAGVFEDLGAAVVDVEVPETQRVAGTSYIAIQLSEPLAAHEFYLRRRPHDYQNQTLALFGLGEPWTAQHYLRAQRIRTINIAEWVGLFGSIDAVLTPTTPRPAPTKEEAEATGVFDLVNYTSFFDLNGCPSISVPAGFTTEGLPVGLMLSARPFDEARLLGLAHAYQEETGFHDERPRLD